MKTILLSAATALLLTAAAVAAPSGATPTRRAMSEPAVAAASATGHPGCSAPRYGSVTSMRAPHKQGGGTWLFPASRGNA